MRTWKWELEVTDKQLLWMPVGAKILDIQMQNTTCCLWALCDPDAKKETRCLAMYGTNHPMPNETGEYIATFQMHNGTLVFHVFDISRVVPIEKE